MRSVTPRPHCGEASGPRFEPNLEVGTPSYPPPRINQDSWGQGSLGNTEHSSDRGKHSGLKNKYFKLLKL